MKICKTCNETKPFDEFSNHPTTADKKYPDCKECQSGKMAELYKQGALFLSSLPVDGSRRDKAIFWGINDKHSVKKFIKKLVSQSNGCIEYNGCKTHNGYGALAIRNGSIVLSTVKAHRFAFALANGFDALPKGETGNRSDTLVINHICHNRACCNPDHLEVMTHAKNVAYRRPKNAA